MACASCSLGSHPGRLACSRPSRSSPRRGAVKVDGDTFGGMEARPIGPAAMGGRIAAIDAVAGERLTIYVGAAGGGLWKSMDGGLRFKPVFDKHSQSIGAITVGPEEPERRVGRARARPGSATASRGRRRLQDDRRRRQLAEAWASSRLERIARIAIDPADAEHGLRLRHRAPLRRPPRARASFARRTAARPGRRCCSWPTTPDAPTSRWTRRTAGSSTRRCGSSGACRGSSRPAARRAAFQVRPTAARPGQRLRRACPRAISAASRSRSRRPEPNVVYAKVEAKESARSTAPTTAARRWARSVRRRAPSLARPFYFSHLVVDPTNWKRVYKPALQLCAERRRRARPSARVAGRRPTRTSTPCGCNPQDPEELIIGTDGGALSCRTTAAARWRFAGSLPVSQFYHVSYDMELPYNVYGGLQDNSTWYGPSRKPRRHRQNKHWHSLTGGDGFWAFVDPNDPDIVYNEYQGGNLFRMRKSTLEQKDIKPSPKARGAEVPLQLEHAHPPEPERRRARIYYGAQFLFRSRDRARAGSGSRPTSPPTTRPSRSRTSRAG